MNAAGPEFPRESAPRPTASKPDVDGDIDPRIGDRVRLRKQHPCGSHEWRVVRIGAHIGLRCEGCQRKVMLVRSQYRKRMAALLERGPDPAAAEQG